MKNEEKSGQSGQKTGKKKLLFILLGAGFGIFLLLLGSGWFTSQNSAEAPAEISRQEELETYRKETEKRIAELCGAVAGVSRVQVSATLSGGFETVYATETRNGTTVYATIGSGSSAKALVVSQNPPEIIGIGVVCRGGGDPAIRGTLTALLSSAFRVPSNRISIAEAG